MTLHTFEILDPDQNVVATHEFDSAFSPWLLEGHTARLVAVDGAPVGEEVRLGADNVATAGQRRFVSEKSDSVMLEAPVQPSSAVEPSV